MEDGACRSVERGVLSVRCEEYEYISFDLYGTLINRSVDSPQDVFKMIEQRFQEINGRTIDGFKKKRIESERRSYAHSESDMSLEKIYGNIDMTKADRDCCMRLEAEIEYDISYPNEEGISLYRYFAGQNKKIIIISDMYLPEIVIRHILRKCGVDDIYKIYISGYEGTNKANRGDLYRKVCSDLKISPQKLLHIGDNIRSDIINAKLNRIGSIRIKKSRMPLIEEYVRNTSSICSCEDEKIGYALFGALTLAYVSWIRSECIRLGINVLYFFSREGWILKKVFDLINKDGIKTKYIYVSRRSLSIPRLRFCESLDDIREIIYIDTPTMPIKRLLYKLGIDENKVRNSLEKNDININDELCRIRDKDVFLSLIMPEMKKVSAEQFEFIKGYLMREIDGRQSKAGIVDIGWTGTMQDNFINILRMCGIDQEIYGFFIGQRKEIEKHINAGMHNLSYLYGYKDTKIREVVESGGGILEFAFSAPHGTTLGYNAHGPILATNDLSNDTLGHLMNIQKGILLFVDQVGKLQEKYNIFSREQIIQHLVRIFKNPPMELLDHIGEWNLFDDRVIRIAHKTPILPVSRFYSEFIESGWGVGFLKRNLKMPLPYFEMVNLMRKVRHLRVWKQMK